MGAMMERCDVMQIEDELMSQIYTPWPWNSHVQWLKSRWHNPQKVVYMDPYINDILGCRCHLLNSQCKWIAWPRKEDHVPLWQGIPSTSMLLPGHVRRARWLRMRSKEVVPA